MVSIQLGISFIPRYAICVTKKDSVECNYTDYIGFLHYAIDLL